MAIAEYSTSDPCIVAKEFNCSYMGDVNTLDHDGHFYSTDNWKENGYSNCLRFQNYEGILDINVGTINRLENVEKEICDVFNIDPDEITIHHEIDYAIGQWGIEEDSSQKFSKIDSEEVCFTLEDGRKVYSDSPDIDHEFEYADSDGQLLTEEGVWESILGWLEGLSDSSQQFERIGNRCALLFTPIHHKQGKLMLSLNSRVQCPGKYDLAGNRLPDRKGTLRGFYGPTNWPLVCFDESPSLTTIVAPSSITQIPADTTEDHERYCIPVQY